MTVLREGGAGADTVDHATGIEWNDDGKVRFRQGQETVAVMVLGVVR